MEGAQFASRGKDTSTHDDQAADRWNAAVDTVTGPGPRRRADCEPDRNDTTIVWWHV